MNVVGLYFTPWLLRRARADSGRVTRLYPSVEKHLPLFTGVPVRSFWEFGGPSANILGPVQCFVGPLRSIARQKEVGSATGELLVQNDVDLSLIHI